MISKRKHLHPLRLNQFSPLQEFRLPDVAPKYKSGKVKRDEQAIRDARDVHVAYTKFVDIALISVSSGAVFTYLMIGEKHGYLTFSLAFSFCISFVSPCICWIIYDTERRIYYTPWFNRLGDFSQIISVAAIISLLVSVCVILFQSTFGDLAS